MLSDILFEHGWPHASWLSGGVYVDGVVQDGELGPWSRVVLAARHREIDVAIQEMDPSTVIAAGLPQATYPLCILTTLCGNTEACLLAEESRLTRKSLEVVIQSVRPDGVLIVNADDYDILALAESGQSARSLYALHRDNPALQQHLEAGGVGAWVEHGTIYYGSLYESSPIIDTGEIPATLHGTILFQIQNALAAVCAAMIVGCASELIANGLRGFSPRPDRQPAACNIFTYNNATMLIDSPYLISSLRMLARGIRHKPHRRTVVVSGSLPGLTEDELHEGGRILGGLGGIVLLHGQSAPAERIEAIKVGIAAAAVPPIVLAIADEQRAIDQMLNTLAPDDLALVIVDDPSVVIPRLWPAPMIDITSGRRSGAQRNEQ
jgi:cyanophycin synthetase